MTAPRHTPRRGGPLRLVPSLLILCCLAAHAAAAAPVHPPTPGVLVVEAALDSLAPASLELAAGTRTWSWAWGALSVDGDLAVEASHGDLRFDYGTDLAGTSRGQHLVFRPDTYPVDGPLLLVGEGFRLFVARGELVVEDERLVLRDAKDPPSPQAQMLLLLGVLLLTGTLMIRARRRLGGGR